MSKEKQRNRTGHIQFSLIPTHLHSSWQYTCGTNTFILHPAFTECSIAPITRYSFLSVTVLLHWHHAFLRLPWQKVRGMCRTQGQGRGVNLTHQLSCHSPTAAQRLWPKLPRGFLPFPQPCKPAQPRAGSLGSNLFPDFPGTQTS